MSTFLELCQDTEEECNVASALSTTASQTGLHKKFVRWVKDAWTEIQNKYPRWRWLQVPFTFDTVASDDTYTYGDVTDVNAATVIARFGCWLADDPYDRYRIYLTSSGISGQGYLSYMPWDLFRSLYKIGTQNTGFPAHITVDPLNNLVLGPSPNGIYTITGEFMRSAQILAANADVPELPTQFHALIRYRAKEKYGYFGSANEIVISAQREGNRLMRQLEQNQLPRFRKAGPLA